MKRLLKGILAFLSGFVLVALVAAVPATPASATTNAGIWWSNVTYPGGIGMQAQYQVIYNGSTEWVRVVGMHEWVGDGSCFAVADVRQYNQFAQQKGFIHYTWDTSQVCHTSLIVDANAGHGYTTAQMPWMEVLPQYQEQFHEGLVGVTTSTSGNDTWVIGG